MARNSPYSNKVHFDESTGLDIELGGEMTIPVTGSTSTTGLASTGTFATASTNIPAFGVSIFSPGSGGAGSTYRVYTLGLPSSGLWKTLIFLSSSSSGIANIDATANALFAPLDGTSQSRYLIAASNLSTGRTTVELVGVSTALWVVSSITPTSGVIYGTTVYSSCT